MTKQDEDRRLAKKILGWHIELIENSDPISGEVVEVEVYCNSDGNYEAPCDVVDFSQWEWAGLLVDAMDNCLHLVQHNQNGKWEAMFCDSHPVVRCEGDTAQEAIRTAAIQMLEVLND